MIDKSQLTEEQLECIDTITALYRNRYPVMTIVGRAGTGKTTIVKHIVENLGINFHTEVAFVAYTGKAALVLRQKGNPASTIHQLIYKAFKNREGDWVFKKKEALDNPKLKLIVIDEISMVDEKLLDEIKSFGIPIIALGDSAQLPPIYSSMNAYISNPDFTLTQIHRQAAENTIIKFGEEIATGQTLTSQYNDAYIRTIEREDLSVGMLEWADQVICCTHKTRQMLNAEMRKSRGFTGKYPEIGDKVICLQNYHHIVGTNGDPLVNGMIGHISEILVKPTNTVMNPWMKVVFRPDYDPVSSYEIVIDLSEIAGVKPYENRGRNPRTTRCLFDFGYAITSYKSQGSQWDKVLIYSSDMFGDKKKHAYTMLTRAAKQVVWVQ